MISKALHQEVAANGVTKWTSALPNHALFTDEKREIFLGVSPELAPTADQCVVRVRSNGICGSDIHFWKAGKIGNLNVNHAYVLGHEGAGEIVWVGPEVTHLAVGDRVAIEPGIPCHHCHQCSTGEYNLCYDVEFSGAPPHNGSIRRFHNHPARYLHKLPDNVSYTDGALLEPLSVAMHAFERSPVKLGESTVICGAGPIGLVSLALAKASGAFPLLITDVDAARLAFAKQFVPECLTVLVPLDEEPLATAARIVAEIAAIGGDEPRVVYECTGVQSSVITATYVPRAGGEVMVVGVGKDIMNGLPFMHVSMREVDIKFINRYHHSWPVAIRLLQSKYIDLKPLVTHRFKLEDAVKALVLSADRTQRAVKVHIEDLED